MLQETNFLKLYVTIYIYLSDFTATSFQNGTDELYAQRLSVRACAT